MKPNGPAMLVIFAAFGALPGCAKKVDVPVTVSLVDKNCSTGFDVAKAKPLSVGADPLRVTVDVNAPCFAGNEGASLYAAFALPRSNKEYFISITSNSTNDGILAPRALLLDKQGHIVREIGRDSFVFHGTALYAGVRIHADEDYLIVASDPRSVGQTVSQTIDTTQAHVVSAGVVYATVFTGSTATKNMTYSHTEVIAIEAKPVPDNK